MTFFVHTRKDLADARKELGFALLALADDTARKMNDEGKERTYLLEDLLTRMVEVAGSVGADVSLFESLEVFNGARTAYELTPFPGSEVPPTDPDDVPTMGAARAAVREVHNTQTFDGYPRHRYSKRRFALDPRDTTCGEQLVSVHNLSGEPVTCGRSPEHAIHDFLEDK